MIAHPTPIRTKDALYARLAAGALGNTMRVWESLAALAASGYRGHVSLRTRRMGGPCLTGIRADQAAYWAERMGGSAGLRPDAIVAQESPPDAALRLQGEVMRSPRHLTLSYATAPLPMRRALRECGRAAEGLRAWALLETHLDAASRADLDALFDRYPDHVVEFSAYRDPVGRVPHRNTVIWEVRSY